MFFATHCLQLLEDKTDKLMKQIQPVLYSIIGCVNCIHVFGCVTTNVSIIRWY